MTAQLIKEAAGKILPEIIELRHELHRHPEIRFQEQWTSDRIAAFLDSIGVSYTRGWAKGTGIVAELKGTGGRTVALRADIDALEMAEPAALPYASENAGRMHACGHDGHIACLCGAAKTLVALRGTFDNTVRFIFQPAEEIGGGGRFMAEEGAVDGVDAVFGLHAWPELPVGKVGLRPGPSMAGADSFIITIRGTIPTKALTPFWPPRT
jgi:amidohydrolase